MKGRRIDKDDLSFDILGDKSAYDEFISTFHYWTGLEGNSKRAQEIGKIAIENNIKLKEE